jgi:hypothetical protein
VAAAGQQQLSFAPQHKKAAPAGPLAAKQQQAPKRQALQKQQQGQKRPASVIEIDDSSGVDLGSGDGGAGQGGRGGAQRKGAAAADSEVTSHAHAAPAAANCVSGVVPNKKQRVAGALGHGSGVAPLKAANGGGGGGLLAGGGALCGKGASGTPKANGPGGGACSAEGVRALLGMGFAEAEARRALWATSGSVDRAVEWLVNGSG